MMIKAALATVVMSTMVAIPTANADTTLYVGGTGADSVATKATNLDWLNHMGPATQVGYPADLLRLGPSVTTGADALQAQVDATVGPVTIVGGSQGALVVEEYKRRLAADPNARTDITFVTFADPTSKHGIFGRNPGITIPGLGYTTTGPTQGPWKSTVVIRQYDGAADWPDDQWNLLADVNAIFGFVYIHPHYGNIDLTGQQPYEVDGNTTYYRIPTAHLPLLQPLRDLGFDQRILNAIEAPLRQIIDSAYHQPHAAPAPAARVSEPKPEVAAVAEKSEEKKPDKPRHRKVSSEDAGGTTSPQHHKRPKSGSVPRNTATHTNSPTEGDKHEDHHRKPVHRSERPDHRPQRSKLGHDRHL